MHVNGKDAVLIPSEARPILFRAGSCKRNMGITIADTAKRIRSSQKCLTR